jgi:2'-5' RNA ligase
MAAPVPGDSGLGFFPLGEVSSEINRWRCIYDPHLGEIAPHITLAYPPFIPERDWTANRPAIAELLKDVRPFSITFKELGTFSGTPSVLWLRPEDGGNLSRLHSALVDLLPAYVLTTPFGYVPHLTLGFFDTPEALAEAQKVILSEIKPLRFEANELIYMVFGDDGVWRTRDRLPLGRPATSLDG